MARIYAPNLEIASAMRVRVPKAMAEIEPENIFDTILAKSAIDGKILNPNSVITVFYEYP